MVDVSQDPSYLQGYLPAFELAKYVCDPSDLMDVRGEFTEVDIQRGAATLAEPTPFSSIVLCLPCLAAARENHRELENKCPV